MSEGLSEGLLVRELSQDSHGSGRLDWILMTDRKLNCVCVVFIIRHLNGVWPFLFPLQPHMWWWFCIGHNINSMTHVILCLVELCVFVLVQPLRGSFGTVMLPRGILACPVLYWFSCHAALCCEWFWCRSAVSTVAQFPVVWSACCQCHSPAPCGVIIMLSAGLCQTSGY